MKSRPRGSPGLEVVVKGLSLVVVFVLGLLASRLAEKGRGPDPPPGAPVLPLERPPALGSWEGPVGETPPAPGSDTGQGLDPPALDRNDRRFALRQLSAHLDAHPRWSRSSVLASALEGLDVEFKQELLLTSLLIFGEGRRGDVTEIYFMLLANLGETRPRETIDLLLSARDLSPALRDRAVNEMVFVSAIAFPEDLPRNVELLAGPEHSRIQFALRALARSAPKKDPESIFLHLRDSLSLLGRSGIDVGQVDLLAQIREAFGSAVHGDRQSLLDWAGRVESDGARSLIERNILYRTEFGKLPPEEVSSIYDRIAQRGDAEMTRLVVSRIIASIDNPQRLADFVSRLDDEARAGAISSAISKLSRTDPWTLLDFVNRLPEGVPPGDWAGSVAKAWVSTPEAEGFSADTAAWYERQSGRSIREDPDWPAILAAWARHDPGPAATVLEEAPAGAGPSVEELKILGRALFQKDPGAAAEFFHRIGPDENAAAALQQVFADLGRASPGAAVEAYSLLAPEARGGPPVGAALATGFATVDFAGALDWALTLPQEDRAGVASSVFQLAHKDPINAAETISAILGGRDARLAGGIDHDAVASVASSAVKADPSFAVEWHRGLPRGPERERATVSMARTWSYYDPWSCSAWLDSVEEGESKDRGIAEMVRNIPDDPLSALEWAGAISDQDLRLEVIGTTLDRLKKETSDEALVRALVSEVELDPETRQGLLEQLGR